MRVNGKLKDLINSIKPIAFMIRLSLGSLKNTEIRSENKKVKINNNKLNNV